MIVFCFGPNLVLIATPGLLDQRLYRQLQMRFGHLPLDPMSLLGCEIVLITIQPLFN